MVDHLTSARLPVGSSLFPDEYRGVAVTTVQGCGLDEDALRRYFLGREAYRRTRYVVVRDGDRTAIVAVRKESNDPLFSPIVDVCVLAHDAECVYLVCPDVDTAVPSAVARAARELAPAHRGVVVQGRYGHVSFIIDPRAVQVTVTEIVPPYPAKLVDQARRVLDVAEDLRPVELVPDIVTLEGLARSRPSAAYLLPCRGGEFAVEGAHTAYLDERPKHEPWVLIGCERSQQIHEHVYGERADQIDICPRNRRGLTGAVLTKCCLLERHIEVNGGRAVVPWGATLKQISQALTALVGEREQAWEPA
ncbi:MAG TPA: hypothetical protein VFJ24_03140 [Gaiellales bacterium]|nr:hypothetical protein [Gaiellales bacterium]